jgi:predicted dehydrogenase
MTRKLATGVVGLGFGANHARVLSQLPGARLAAVCDANPERLAASSYGAARYSDLGTMLREERLNALVVATPAHLHAPMALSAIEAGCAVLVEKPLATSYEEGARLVAAAAAAGVPLMPGHIERFNPALRELARRVRAGEIGRVLQLTARRMGAIRLPPTDVNVVHDSAIHDIDALRFVLGREVEEVYAVAQRGVVMPVEDAISGVLRFAPGADGAAAPFASLEVNWLSPRRVRDLTVLGENGMFVLQYASQTLELYRAPPRSGPVQGWSLASDAEARPAEKIAIEPQEQLVEELVAFLDAVRDGTPIPVSAEDGLAALAIADALTRSARTGSPMRPVRPEA